MRKRFYVFLGAILLGIGLLITSVVVFEFEAIAKIVIEFYSKITGKVVLSLMIASFVPGVIIGQKFGPINKKS